MAVNLRKGARGECCTLLIEGVCLHTGGSDPEHKTTVLAHLRTLKNGAGEGLKPDDKFGVYACFECHGYMDSAGVQNMPLQVLESALKRTRARQKFKGEL